MTDPAARVAVGIVTGLHQVREPEDGSVLAYAGPDCPGELADEIIDEAERLGVAITSDEMDDAIHEWLDLD